MALLLPSPEFHFPTAMNTPSISAPSSPPNLFPSTSPFLHVSAPSSPTAALLAALRRSAAGSRHSAVPFDWELKPGTPKHLTSVEKSNSFDFDFDFPFQFNAWHPLSPENPAAAADELFDCGKIRPLKPPPRLCSPAMSEQGIKELKNRGFFSPLRRGRNRRGEAFDPFVVAMVEATKSRRDKGGSFMNSATPPPPSMAAKGWKCRLKGFLLFRSSSEGKRSDFSKYGSSSSSSSASSNSSVGSGKGKMGFGVSGGGAAAGGGGGGGRELSFMSEEMVAPYKQRLSFVESFAAGKFGASFFRRRF